MSESDESFGGSLSKFLGKTLELNETFVDGVSVLEKTTSDIILNVNNINKTVKDVIKFLKFVGILETSESLEDKVDRIITMFEDLFEVVSEADQAERIRDIAEKHNEAINQVRKIRNELAINENLENLSESERALIDRDTSLAVVNLGDIDFYKRPFYEQEFYEDSWSRKRPPPEEGGLAFDYRQALLAFLHCIQIRLEILLLLEWETPVTAFPEWNDLARDLEVIYYKIFNEALFELPLPTMPFWYRITDPPSAPSGAEMANPLHFESIWERRGGRLYGVVDLVSGIGFVTKFPREMGFGIWKPFHNQVPFHPTLDAWSRPLNVFLALRDEFPQDTGTWSNEYLRSAEFPARMKAVRLLYWQFALRHQLLTRKRKKQLYQTLGLDQVWSILQTLNRLAPDRNHSREPDFGNTWSLKEVDKIVAKVLFAKDSTAEQRNSNTISLKSLLGFLGTESSGRVSLKESIESAMGEAL